MRLIIGPYQMSLERNEKAALVLMHDKANRLLHYHSMQTTPVGTSAHYWSENIYGSSLKVKQMESGQFASKKEILRQLFKISADRLLWLLLCGDQNRNL